MAKNTQRDLVKAQRELEMWKFKARFVTLGWLLVPCLSAGVIYGAATVDAGLCALFIFVVALVAMLCTFSFDSTVGTYIKIRETKWKIEDLTNEIAEQVVNGDGM